MLTKSAQYDLLPYPNINAHSARIAARPAYQKAMALADPLPELRSRLNRPRSSEFIGP
jgi:hypothetical protein